jgi:iron complex outermembrane receptor protein
MVHSGNGRHARLSCRWLAAALSIMAAGIQAGWCTELDTLVNFDINAQKLSAALLDFSRQSQLQVLVDARLVGNLDAPAVRGRMSPLQAMTRLLERTNLVFESVGANAIAISGSGDYDSKGDQQVLHQGLRFRLAALFGICVAVASTNPACAQSAAAASAGETADQGIQEVVVTAEKFSQDLEKAPVAVTALTADELTSMGVKSAIDLTAVVPNFTAMPNANGSTVALRGVVSTNQSVNGTSEVSYSEDGVSLVDMRDAFDGMYDINRVEVLRGPQGTLYGANANAGSINVVTNKPDLTGTSAYGSVGFGNYSAFSTSGALNLPISDTLGIRIAADDERHSGYIYLTTNNSRFEDQDFIGGRVHVLWKPSDAFSALLTYETVHNGGAGSAGSASGAPLGLYATSQGVSPYSYASMPGPMSLQETDQSGTLTLNWSLPLVDITNISSVRFDDWMQADAETIYGPNATYCQNINVNVNCFNPLINSSNDRQQSDELRLSHTSQRLQWLLGAYYMQYDAHLAQSYEPSNKVNQWELLDEPGYVGKARAIYGQATWSLTDKLSLVGGLRYQWDSESLPYSPAYYGPIGSIVQQQCFGCTITSVYSGAGSWGKMTWRAGLNYNLTPESFLFASVATGYEQGGFGTKATQPFNPDYGPENLTNYEVGWKNKLWQNRVQLNIDAYYMDYRDYQASGTITLANGTAALLTTNAGKATIKGVELESVFLLTPADQLTFNVTGLDAVFTQFYLPKGDGYAATAGTVPVDYTGNQLPYGAHVTGRLDYQHTFALTGIDSLILQAGTNYSSHYYTDYHNYVATSQDAYFRSSATVTWERHVDGRKFSTRLYVHNLENRAVLAGGQADSNAPGRDFNDYAKNGYYLPPRTYGLQFIATF